MKYQLVTTKQGPVPIEEIQQGTEVLCSGEWKIADKPIISNCIKCTFNTLPTTSFNKDFYKDYLSIYTRAVFNKSTIVKPELSVRGYLAENTNRHYGFISFMREEDTVYYWYPRLIKYFNYVMPPDVKNKHVVFNVKIPKFTELKGDDFSERNLEYYLEGLLRRRLFYQDSQFKLSDMMTESDKMVTRLLGLTLKKVALGIATTNPTDLLKRIKDKYNKKKITTQMIINSLKISEELPIYIPAEKPIKIEEVEDWIIPNVNADINTISTSQSFYKKKFTQKEPFDKLGRVNAKYNYNSLYEKLKNT